MKRLIAMQSLLLVVGLASHPVHAAPVGQPDPVVTPPVDPGSSWLAGQLDNGLLPGPFGGVDVGLTIDAGLSFLEVGDQSAAALDILDGVEAEVGGFVAYDYTFDGTRYTGEIAGAFAKAATLVETAGADPTSCGGLDLIGRLEALVGDDGRIFDTAQGAPDYALANTIGQAYTARALVAASSAEAAPVVDVLLKQQCTQGFFRLDLPGPGQASADCDHATPAAQPNVDATAIAVLDLLDVLERPNPPHRVDVAAAIDDATAWLTRTQAPDGGIGSDAFITTPNANSTGLTAWTLGAAGKTEAARRSATWLRRHQFLNAGPCTPYDEADEGAVAYDDTAFAEQDIAPESSDQFRRVLAQALPGLAYAPTDVSDQLHRTTFERAGTTKSLRVQGNPGDPICLDGPTRNYRRVPADGTATFVLRLPAATTTRHYRISDAEGSRGTVLLRVLAKTKFKVSTVRRVQTGHKITVSVSGLAPGEGAVFRVNGTRKATGVAGSHGRLVRAIRLTGKPRSVAFRVTGAFADIRHGSTRVRIGR